MHRVSLKESRFVFQQSEGNPQPSVGEISAEVEAPASRVSIITDKTKPHKKGDGSFLNADGSKYNGKDTFTDAGGEKSSMSPKVAKEQMDVGLPVLLDSVPAVTAERAVQKLGAGREVVLESTAKSIEDMNLNYKAVLKLVGSFDKMALKNELFSGGTIVVKNLLAGDFIEAEAVLKDEASKRLMKLDLAKETATFRSTKQDLVEMHVGIKVAGMIGKLKNLLKPGGEMEHLAEFMKAHQDKLGSRATYTIKIDRAGGMKATLSLVGDLATEYGKYVAKKVKPVTLVKKNGEKDVRPKISAAKKALKKNPLLRFLAGIGLFNKKALEKGGPDGYDRILAGDVDAASIILGILGWKEGAAALASVKGMAPGKGGEIIAGFEKQFNTSNNPLSARGAAKRLAKKTGKPTEVIPGFPPTIAHKMMGATVFDEIVKGNDKMPVDGLALTGPVDIEKIFGAGKALKVDLNAGGKFSLPEKTSLTINGSPKTVGEGTVEVYDKSKGNKGILLISGTLLPGTVIDTQVQLEVVDKIA